MEDRLIRNSSKKYPARSGFRKLIIFILLTCMIPSMVTDAHGEENEPEIETETKTPASDTGMEDSDITDTEEDELPVDESEPPLPDTTGEDTDTPETEEDEPPADESEPPAPDTTGEDTDTPETGEDEVPVEGTETIPENPAAEISTVSGSGWIRNQSGWWYRRADGSYPVNEWLKLNGVYYHFDSRGYMQTGWIYVNKDWYYLRESGAMVSSAWIGNYYLKSDGRMARSEWVNNGKYYVGSDGKWIKDYVTPKWIKDSKGWWYRRADRSYPVNEWLKLNGIYYHFDSRGYMQTGWIQVNGDWYYLKETGAMVSSVWIGNYYLKSDGRMARNEWVNNKKYYVGSDGKWIRYYGIKGWQKNSKGWWYSRGDGTYPASKWEYINHHYYYFNAKGYMMTGWLKLKNKWYYLENSGAMRTGWLKYKNKWYYLKDSGEMACDEVIGDYYLDENGVWLEAYNRTLTIAEGVSNESIYMKGIDISSWNGNIDLSYYQDGFVMIRASWGEHEDQLARRNMDLCEELGIPYGVYVYSYALSDEKAADEADFLLDIIEGRNIQCGVWFDMEDSDGYKARNGISQDDSVISSMCKTFCDKVAQAGYHAGIYASYSWFENYITGCDQYDKWVAHWGVNDGELNRNLSDMAVIHQYTSEPLDKNVMYVDLSHFSD